MRSWGSALLHGGHWPVVMAYLLFVLFFYIPANNQVFQAAESCVAFFITLGGWLFTSPSRMDKSHGPEDEGQAEEEGDTAPS
ncbi:hypothetical protein HHL11_28790 [Ramlibacter sp. G-1-2-2]|uniref:Uncharacterized protein n=1 Tax=Ramlibacter agri TaxID=2728837 RepID=A0A848HE75_9BURK|nr:hypothetical protein [Ramlibacter agri]NML47780.1 hypothetical protein [Ramlibacter agri]